MRFAISIPQYARDSRFDAEAFRAHLTRTEELGVFESGWVQEQVLGAAGSLAPLETLTYAAACTERLRLGCAVFVLPLHNPVHLAKAIGSLDCLSHGRIEVGIASGGRGAAVRGLRRRPRQTGRALQRGARADEELLDGGSDRLRRTLVEAAGNGDGAEAGPGAPIPPIWFGGRVPAGLRRAVRHGDGFMGAGSQTTAGFAEQVEFLRQELAAQERDPATFRIGKRVYIHVEEDEALAR